MISKLIEDLKSDEGWRPDLYQDSLGFLTIGYGFLVDPKKGGRLPRKVGDLWLEHEVEEKWAELVQAIPWILTLPDDVQRAVANMAYQMGVPGLLKFKLMLKSLERGDRETAAANALASKWYTQTPQRAERVVALMRGY